MRRSRLALASLAGIGLAACVTTQTVQVQLTAAPASAQWQGAWGGSVGGGVTALPGGGLTFPSGQILAPNGSVALPAYSFASDPSVGLFFGGPGSELYMMNPGSYMVLRTGGANNFAIGAPNATGGIWNLLSNAAGGHLQPSDDNTRDLGGAGVRPRALYLGTSINFAIPTVPGTPAAGTGVLYMKADKKLYFKNDAALETALW